VIHDIGYRHYEGPRLGRGHAIAALFVHSLRAAFGIGRPLKSKLVPFALLTIIAAPGVIDAAIVTLLPLPPISYLRYPYLLQVALMVFVAAQAPQLVTSDRRFRVLPLYASRPLERDDYVWAKLAAFASAIMIVLALPMLILYAAIVLGHTHRIGDVTSETERLLMGLTGAAAYAIVLAALALTISAFTRVRAFAIIAVVGVFLVTGAIVTAVIAITQGATQDTTRTIAALLGMLSPFTLVDGFVSWMFRASPASQIDPSGFGWLYAVTAAALIAATTAILLFRYRSTDG
jgi:ABC-2 type transport system permease protein